VSGTERGPIEEIISTRIVVNEAKWSCLGVPFMYGCSRCANRGSGVRTSTSYISVLISFRINVSSELPVCLRRCLVGAASRGPSNHKVVMDEGGMATDVEAKLLFINFKQRSVFIDRMSF